MNLFQRARNEAHATRAKLAPGLAHTPIPAKNLLLQVESILNVAIEQVAPTYADLGGGSAVLQREQQFIYVSTSVDEWGDEFCGLVAHELGHFFLDGSKAPTTIAHLSTLFGSEGSPGVMKVEAYGARERQELQANVFARELLLPRDVARDLAVAGKGATEIAKLLGVPREFVRQQMLDALLLPEATTTSTSLSPPSPDQLAAAMAEERAANVVAGPGTGKTTTLIHRVKYLVEVKKIHPSQIIALTFTNKAAFELVERLRSAGINDAAEIWAGTFHAFGLEFLRKYHQRFGLDADVHVSDRLSSITMLVAGLPRVSLSHFLRVEDPYEWLGPVIESISRLKEELVTPEAYRCFVDSNPAQDLELQRKRLDVAILYELHETLLAERKTVDFVDLIAKPAVALKVDRTPFAEVTDRFKYVLVDEYQDVTQAMVEMLRQLAYKKSIWVVGDVRQAIHHWRGASLKSLMKFDSVFKAHAGGTTIPAQQQPSKRSRDCRPHAACRPHTHAGVGNASR
jgi:Zn-dependent peptidase ImmA (M78 family)